MKNRIGFYALISTSIIISCCCSFVIGWFPIFFRTWIWSLFLVVFSVALYNDGLKSKYIIPLFLYGAVLLLNAYSGDEKFGYISSIMEFSYFTNIYYCFYLYSQERFSKYRNRLILVFGLTLLITFVGTTSVYLTNPEVLRLIQAEMNIGNSNLFLIYGKMGVESYAMGHALPVFLPILVFVFKMTKKIKYRIFLLLMLFVLVSLVYMATATTALLLAMILVLVSFFWNDKNKAKNIFVLSSLLLVALFFLGNRELLGSVLESINIDPETTYAGKIRDFQDYANYGKAGDQTGYRFKLYKDSFTTFLSHPIVGVNNKSSIGEHSVILDRFAMLGLIGMIPLFVFLSNYMKFVQKKLTREVRPYFVLGFIYFLLISVLKNIISFDYIVTCLLIMPLVCISVDQYVMSRK